MFTTKQKIIFVITLTTLLAVAAFGATPYNETQLAQWYRWYNEELFNGKLTTNVVIRWGDLTAQKEMAETQCNLDHTACKITLDKATNITERTTQWTLIHEMCHVKVPAGKELDAHGPLFQSCMMNIALSGGFENVW